MKGDYEKTYRSMTDDLAKFFNTSKKDISGDELRYAFPIQFDLNKDQNRYTEKEEIAQGGVKKIIRVIDHKTDRSVAKAVLLKDSGKEGIEEFLREARLTSSLQHPNIIPIYDMGLESDGSPYFTMEHLTGDTLGHVVKKLSSGDDEYLSKYSQSVLLDIFSRICDAIAYAHSRNIIHLDLKPENIHINSYGQVHVCDWGLGKIIHSDEEPEKGIDADLSQLDLNILNTMTLNGEIKGTPGFMAPEQTFSGKIKDERTDIYSLGAILFNLLSHKTPVQGKSIEDIIKKTAYGEIEPLDIGSESLKAITLKALNKNPDNRYESVEEFSADLDKYRHGFATNAENAGFITQAKLLVKRNKTASSLIVAFIVILSVSGIFAFQKINNEKKAALSSQTKAEKSLKLFLDERELTEAQGKNIDKLVVEIAKSEDLTNPVQQIAILEQGLDRNLTEKETKLIHKKLSILHFILQKFNKSLENISKLHKRDRPSKLFETCKRYESLKKEGEFLDDQDLAELINFLSHNQRYIIPDMYAYHMKKTKKRDRVPAEYWPLAKAMLMMVNNYWNTDPLDRDLVPFEDGYALDLSNTRYRYYRCHSESFSVNILGPLKLRKLDLSNTPFFEFWQLAGIKLSEINLTGCWVREIHLKNLNAIEKMAPNKIIIDGSLYPTDSLKYLKKKFNVVDSSNL